MSAYTTIARPYAKAAFENALATNSIPAWHLFLQRAGMIVQDKRVQTLLQNPQLEMQTKLNFLSNLSDCDSKISGKEEQKNLLAVLAKYNRLLAIPSLLGVFNELVKQYENIVDVTVTSAFAFSVEQQKLLQKALEIRLGKQVKIKVAEDKNLIGGAVIRAGDFVIDGSVQGKLKRLRKAVIN